MANDRSVFDLVVVGLSLVALGPLPIPVRPPAPPPPPDLDGVTKCTCAGDGDPVHAGLPSRSHFPPHQGKSGH